MGDELSHGQTWWRTEGRTDARTEAGNDNTRRPILASGKNWKICLLYSEDKTECRRASQGRWRCQMKVMNNGARGKSSMARESGIHLTSSLGFPNSMVILSFNHQILKILLLKFTFKGNINYKMHSTWIVSNLSLFINVMIIHQY